MIIDRPRTGPRCECGEMKSPAPDNRPLVSQCLLCDTIAYWDPRHRTWQTFGDIEEWMAYRKAQLS